MKDTVKRVKRQAIEQKIFIKLISGKVLVSKIYFKKTQKFNNKKTNNFNKQLTIKQF